MPESIPSKPRSTGYFSSVGLKAKAGVTRKTACRCIYRRGDLCICNVRPTCPFYRSSGCTA